MAHPVCLRCLSRSLRSAEAGAPATRPPTAAAFSTTSLLAAKKAVAAKSNKGTRTLVLGKKKRVAAGRPPAPGERKAARKKVVLNNTNALEVSGLGDLTAEKLGVDGATTGLDASRGSVLGFTGETVEALKALESFKPTQGWRLFRRPATLIREESVELARRMEGAGRGGSGKAAAAAAVRQVIAGERDSGKSVLLLQAHAMAFLKGWVVIHVPEMNDVTNGQTSFQPVQTPDGTRYIQPHYTARLLGNTARANQKVLRQLQVSQQHELAVPIQPNMSLDRFAELGAQDPELAWPIWTALWKELTTTSRPDLHRPPVLVSADGADRMMRTCGYDDADAKPIHAFDLLLVSQLIDHLTGRTSFPNGGMVMLALSRSNRASTPTLDYSLALRHQASSSSSPHEEGPSTQKTVSTGGVPTARDLATPWWDPYTEKDRRVDDAVRGASEVVTLEGLSKKEARGIMDYYARSGLFRGSVTDGVVSEKWSMAGQGIIGQLEKGSVGLGA